jgi:hypothetical protein
MIRVRLSDATTEGLADELFEELRPRMEAAITKGGTKIVERARSLLSRPAESASVVSFRMRGKVFRKKGRKVEFAGTTHAGAAAGEPPRMRTSELRDSVEAKPPRWTKSSVRVEYGSALPWAGRMEWGGKDNKGRYLPPHPFIRPAEEQMRQEVERILEEL